MSARTAAAHTAAELTFKGMDELGEIAYFWSASASKGGKHNVTAWDRTTGTAYCFCRAAELGKDCWHVAHVEAAYIAHVAAETVAKATTLAEVEAIGRAAKAQIAACGALVVLVSPLDMAVYREARRVYARLFRADQGHAALVAVVAEWEGMSYSDRAIDAGYGGMTAYLMAQDALIAQQAA